MTKQILNYLDADTQKKDVLKKRHDYQESISFIDDLGSDFFKLAYYDVKDKDVKAHNIIKTIVITNIYRNEKKNIFKLLEILDTTEGEFIFIDIVVPTRQIIDFRNIELLLSKKDIMKGLAYTLWDFITEYESDLVKPQKSIEEKITELFESGIIMPIVDDYLLYHKDAEKYDRFEEKTKHKEDTKIRYIINILINILCILILVYIINTSFKWLELFENPVEYNVNDKSVPENKIESDYEKETVNLTNLFKKVTFFTYDLELLKEMWKVNPINYEIFEVLPVLFNDMNNSNMVIEESGEIDSQYKKFNRWTLNINFLNRFYFLQ